MTKKQRTCVVCGSKYSYCPICGADKNKPTWYAACCSEECHSAVTALADYAHGVISKDDAKEILSQIDKDKLATMDKYTDTINDIIGKPKKAKKKIEEPVAE